jgi:RNA polymerase sigma-70 factor (ECF subfamily)
MKTEEPVDYETLLTRCADRAYNFAFRLTGNQADAHDLVQEAFARAFEHRDRYDPARPFSAWLNRILHNIFLDSVRRYDKKHNVSLDAPPPFDADGSWTDILPGPDPEPAAALMKTEEEQMLQTAINRLPIHYRTAVTLYDIEGLSYEEISRITQCPIGTVCSRIHQGRMLLKKTLEKMNKPKKVAFYD